MLTKTIKFVKLSWAKRKRDLLYLLAAVSLLWCMIVVLSSLVEGNLMRFVCNVTHREDLEDHEFR